MHKYFISKILFAAAASFLLPQMAVAQASDQQQAQAYYFEAEAALADRRYDIAQRYVDQAKVLLDGSNAKLAALEVRILFGKEDYLAAQAKIDEFFAFNPGPNLQREISSLVVRIDEAAESQRRQRLADQARLEKARVEAAQKAAKEREAQERLAEWQKPSELVTLRWSQIATASDSIRLAGISVGPSDEVSFANFEKYSESRGAVRRGEVKDGCAISQYDKHGRAIGKRAFRIRHYCFSMLPKNDGEIYLASTYSLDGWELVLLKYDGSGGISRTEDSYIPKGAERYKYYPEIIARLGSEFFTGMIGRSASGATKAGFVGIVSDERALVWNYGHVPLAVASEPSGGLYHLSEVSDKDWDKGRPIQYAVEYIDRPAERGFNRVWRNEFEIEGGLNIRTMATGSDGSGYALLRTTKGFDREYYTAIAKSELGETTNFASYKPVALGSFRGEILREHPEGGLLIAGSNEIEGNQQPTLVRLDENLAVQWVKTIESDGRSITHMEFLSNGDVVVAGHLDAKRSWIGVAGISTAP